MKFVEYVELRESDSIAYSIDLLQELLANENYNPEGVAFTDEQLNEMLGGWWDAGKRALSGLWGAAKTFGTDVGRAAMNLPGQLSSTGQEYGTSFKLNTKIAKANDLLGAVAKVNKALDEDPDFAGMAGPGVARGIAALNKVLNRFLNSVKKQQGEFEAQRKDRSMVSFGPATTDKSTRLPGQRRRKTAMDTKGAADAEAKRI